MRLMIIYSQHLIEMFAQNVKVNLAKFGCLFVKAERVINKQYYITDARCVRNLNIHQTRIYLLFLYFH